MEEFKFTDTIIAVLNEELGKHGLCSYVVTQSGERDRWGQMVAWCNAVGSPIKEQTALRIIPRWDGVVSASSCIIAHVTDGSKLNVMFFRDVGYARRQGVVHRTIVDVLNFDDPDFIDKLVQLCLVRFPSFSSI